MRKLSVLLLLAFFLGSCNTGSEERRAAALEAKNARSVDDYDPNRGEGKFTAENVTVGTSLDKQMAMEGQRISEMKCESCHKLSDEMLVGPGWKGVTTRHKPEWIMNFMTNTDAMLDKDPKAQAMLEICMVRMPNQNLTDNDARAVLEFMRENDGIK